MKIKDLENKLEKIIDGSYQEEKKAIYENLKNVFDFLDGEIGAPAESQSVVSVESQSAVTQKPASKWRTSFKNFFKTPARLAACLYAAVAVACLAIILPFTLNGGSGSQTATTNPPSTSEDRFCAAATCKEIELDYSLKEYSELNSLSLLYLDWYDVADIKTLLNVNREDSTDIIYYEEILKHKYTGSIAELYIADMRNRVDKLEDYIKVCNNLYDQKDPHFKVKWGSDTAENGKILSYTAYFRHTKYLYVLVLRYPMSENSIFELIESMLPTIRKINL
ncbi:MAG: hypothetical protein J1F61_02565 [Clostridiales bacterium]|nr:hypothetical protein [Clostridiales bacterium]